MIEIRFAENLKSLRTAKKLTQGQLATLLNVDQRTVSAWEKGVCEPSFNMLNKLCEIFEEDFISLTVYFAVFWKICSMMVGDCLNNYYTVIISIF